MAVAMIWCLHDVAFDWLNYITSMSTDAENANCTRPISQVPPSPSSSMRQKYKSATISNSTKKPRTIKKFLTLNPVLKVQLTLSRCA